MRWKYYLRGLGCGILISTIILAITLRVHKEQLTDSEIIERAEALGMVMEDSQKSSLWNLDDTGTEDDTNAQPVIAGQEPSASGNNPGGQEPSSSENNPNGQEPSNPENNPGGQEPSNSENNSNGQEPSNSGDDPNGQVPVTSESSSVEREYITVEISPGEYTWTLSLDLEEKALIADAAEFRTYMQVHGYDGRLVNGVYQVPVGATLEELAVLFTTEPAAE